MKKILSLTILFAALLVAAVSCKKDDPKPAPGKDDPKNPPTDQKVEVVSVTLNEETLTLEVGAEGTLTAAVEPANATDKTITWSSSDTDIATVENGKVTAIALGEATITATAANGKKAECVVTVAPPAAGTEKTIEGIETVYIPAGTFLMGSPEDEPDRYLDSEGDSDELQHSVTLTKGYYMGKYEITNAQYCEFLNANKTSFETEYYEYQSSEELLYYYEIYMTIDGSKVEIVETDSGQEGVQYDATKEEFCVNKGYENYPMKYVSWYGATEYAAWVGGALPTEAQWEYACRGGQTESLPFGIGDGTKLIGGMANFDTQYPYDLAQGGEYEDPAGGYDDIVAVGSYEYPNGWGLYDMHGNVEEWCSDWYSEDYYSDNQTDPTGPELGEYRVLRGGCFYYNNAQICRSACRNADEPDDGNYEAGFRVIFPE